MRRTVVCMAATKTGAPDAPPVLDFDAIERRFAEIQSDVESLEEFLGYDRTTIWRWKNGLTVPSWATTRQIAAKLGMTLDEIQPKQTHTPPPPGPSSPPPPTGPSGPSAPRPRIES